MRPKTYEGLTEREQRVWDMAYGSAIGAGLDRRAGLVAGLLDKNQESLATLYRIDSGREAAFNAWLAVALLPEVENCGAPPREPKAPADPEQRGMG